MVASRARWKSTAPRIAGDSGDAWKVASRRIASFFHKPNDGKIFTYFCRTLLNIEGVGL
jgi:hypothetical protein